MDTMTSQITSLAIVYSTVHAGADQRKHQSSASLAFVWGIHRGPVNSPHKWPVTRKMFPFDDIIMTYFFHGSAGQTTLFSVPDRRNFAGDVSTLIVIIWFGFSMSSLDHIGPGGRLFVPSLSNPNDQYFLINCSITQGVVSFSNVFTTQNPIWYRNKKVWHIIRTCDLWETYLIFFFDASIFLFFQRRMSYKFNERLFLFISL